MSMPCHVDMQFCMKPEQNMQTRQYRCVLSISCVRGADVCAPDPVTS